MVVGERPPAAAFGDPWSVSAVTAGVLLAGDGAQRAARLRRLTRLIAVAAVLPIDHSVAARYGELRAASGRRPANDLWTAATALAHGLTLVTRDESRARLALVRTRLLPG